jgi:hypothetical protein
MPLSVVRHRNERNMLTTGVVITMQSAPSINDGDIHFGLFRNRLAICFVAANRRYEVTSKQPAGHTRERTSIYRR